MGSTQDLPRSDSRDVLVFAGFIVVVVAIVAVVAIARGSWTVEQWAALTTLATAAQGIGIIATIRHGSRETARRYEREEVQRVASLVMIDLLPPLNRLTKCLFDVLEAWEERLTMPSAPTSRDRFDLAVTALNQANANAGLADHFNHLKVLVWHDPDWRAQIRALANNRRRVGLARDVATQTRSGTPHPFDLSKLLQEADSAMRDVMESMTLLVEAQLARVRS